MRMHTFLRPISLIACLLIGATRHAGAFTVSYDIVSTNPVTNTTRMDNDEAFDQMTVSHNIQSTTSTYRAVGDLEIADTLDSFVFSTFRIAAAAPISMSFEFDLGLMGTVPYTVTLNQMQIELPAGTGPLQIQVDGQFSPYLGTQQNLTATYSYAGTIDILGAITPFTFSDTTALDIIHGELDQVSAGIIGLQMQGKFGGSVNTIYSGTHLGKDIEIHLINDHFFDFAGNQIPEPSTSVFLLSAAILAVGYRTRRRL